MLLENMRSQWVFRAACERHTKSHTTRRVLVNWWHDLWRNVLPPQTHTNKCGWDGHESHLIRANLFSFKSSLSVRGARCLECLGRCWQSKIDEISTSIKHWKCNQIETAGISALDCWLNILMFFDFIEEIELTTFYHSLIQAKPCFF